MELNNLINTGNLSVGKLEYPQIICDDKDIRAELGLWLHTKLKVNEKFGKILAGLGFKAGDKIVLKNMVASVMRNEVTFDYSVNGEDKLNNKITLVFANYMFDYRLIVCNELEEVVCACSVIDSKDIELKIKSYDKKIDDNRGYNRNFNNDYAEFIVIYGDIELKLKLHRDYAFFYGSSLVLEQEKMLQDYLESLVLPMDIDDIYKGISSLIDVSLYPTVKLKISRIKEEDKVVTDMIILRNGECEKFMMTRGCKTICINKDGTWTYNIQSDLVSFTEIGNEKGVTYNVSLEDKNEAGKYFADTFEDDRVNANVDVKATNRLVRELFPKRKSN